MTKTLTIAALLVLGCLAEAQSNVRWTHDAAIFNTPACFETQSLNGSVGCLWINGSSLTFQTPQGTPVAVTGIANKPYIDVVRDCGARGDGITDDGPAIQACFDLYPGNGFFFPQTIAHNCSYFSNQTLFPKGSGVQIGGQSGSQYLDDTTPAHMGGTEICFATGITGFWLEINAPYRSYGGAIRNISLRGKGGITSLQTPTAINVSGTLPQFTRNIASIQRATNVLTVTVTPFNGAGSEALVQQVNSTVKITGVVGDTTMNGNCVISALSGYSSTGGNPTTFTCPQNGSDAGPFTTDGSIVLPTTGASTADGIRVCSNFWTIDHVGIIAFERHGINADSQAGDGCSLPFSDDLNIRDSMSMENGGDGYYGEGGDANAGTMTGNTFYYNFLYGIHDESAEGNTWVGGNISNNGHLWATSTQPATKAISTIARTLTGGSSQVTVVLSLADANIKLGSCVVIAGVTDSSFNTTAGQCFFINTFTDSTHFGYEQPGAPANASSSGGTSRMAKFSEVYLSSGVDDGGEKIQTHAGFSPLILNQYVEGGQGCKWGGNTLSILGASSPTCSGGGDWVGQFITTQGCSGLGGHLCMSPPSFVYNKDAIGETIVRAGQTINKQYWFTWYNQINARAWILIGDPSGTLGGSGSVQIQSGNGQTRLALFGKDTNTGHTYLNAEGAGGKVIIGRNFAGTNAGTGGLEVWSGGSSPTKQAGIDGTGLVTVGSTTVASLPAAVSNPGAMIRVSDSTTVSAEGQTCVGSSSNNALAFSNGSVWKCF